ncbi:hypothetical protein PF006_g17719 [Phytophthora fragariae]|uniref:Retrotransposon gag domain-containing protein n=1 Tax=Phytophthora fragariae TaxID=53985 RepID=A0A6A3SQR0_9STRA|nr:hypothetical protein PF006_g17719 [Phytophthora fragariae]
MGGPARQWYLQLPKKAKTSWTDLMEQFRIQYCGKGVAMASRYIHAAQRPDETPLDYLYRLNVAGLRANVPYAEGTTEEKREHVEHFIRTLNSHEADLASRLTLMESLTPSRWRRSCEPDNVDWPIRRILSWAQSSSAKGRRPRHLNRLAPYTRFTSARDATGSKRCSRTRTRRR